MITNRVFILIALLVTVLCGCDTKCPEARFDSNQKTKEPPQLEKEKLSKVALSRLEVFVGKKNYLEAKKQVKAIIKMFPGTDEAIQAEAWLPIIEKQHKNAINVRRERQRGTLSSDEREDIARYAKTVSKRQPKKWRHAVHFSRQSMPRERSFVWPSRQKGRSNKLAFSSRD